MDKHRCSLCNSQTINYAFERKRNYLFCSVCNSIQMDPKYYISLDNEKKRYELHKSDISDLGYQKFVKPITDYVFKNINEDSVGLDFGAGHGPVISELLKEKGFKIKIYDPFFHKDKSVLDTKYDYIISCEVIEHFHNPDKEFNLLRKLLKANGKLILMTDPYNDEVDFSKWYYKNDETHVFFYTEKTFEYIKEHYDFKNIIINKRLIIFET